MPVKIRDFEVRLTRDKKECQSVRQLRYRIFITEQGMPATPEMHRLGEEWDKFDEHADYIGVFHNGEIVGTYRIIDRAAAEKMGGFYSETEFDISKIKRIKGNLAEMSRACVAPDYRENPLVMSMLWVGLSEYIQNKKIQVLFGMVSWFGSIDTTDYAHALSYLYYNHLSPAYMRAVLQLDKLAPGVNPKLSRMNILPREFVNKDKAMREMTPLLKGYLRLNATFGNGVSIVPAENDVAIFSMILTKNINAAYQKRFTGDERAFDELGLKTSAIRTIGKLLLLPLSVGLKTIKHVAGMFLTDEEMKDAEIIE